MIKTRKISICLAALMLFSVMIPSISSADRAKKGIEVSRIAGANRMETAINISKEAYSKSDEVILAGYTGEVDALAGTILAGRRRAPMLLVPQNKLPREVVKEIERLGAKKVYILGGTSVVSLETEMKLKESYIVTRLAGKSRAETAVAIADEAVDHTNEIFLALGYGNLADALTIGPVSAINNTPILLSNQNSLPKETIDKINRMGLKKITIIGGYNAISQQVVDSLPRGVQVDRIGGIDREDTAIRIAEKYLAPSKKAIIANGYRYTDALVGGHLAAKNNTPILLARDSGIKDSTLNYMYDNSVMAKLLGGNVALSQTVENSIKDI